MTRLLASVIFSTSLALGGAEARQKFVDVTPNNKTCFDVDYVPALYSVQSRGQLVRKEGVERTFAIVEQVGGTVVYTRQPAVWLETRRLVEPDHYTMRPAACR